MTTKAMTGGIEERSVETFADAAESLNKAFHAKLEKYGPHLFVVDSKHLSTQYLNSFQYEDERKEHDCHACREFMRQYGNVVFINDRGVVIPALWDSSECNSAYAEHVAVLEHAVSRGKIVSQFFCESTVLGAPKVGGLPHFHMTHNVKGLMNFRRSSAEAQKAISAENFKTLSRALSEYGTKVLSQALHLLQQSNRPEKFTSIVEWMLELHKKIGCNPKARTNIIWSAVAAAPIGFCQPRSSVVGSLLDELKEGADPDAALRRFNEKISSEVYQRPTALPSSGNVRKAEKLIAELGLESALARRPAGVNEVKMIWRPEIKQVSEGVFGKLRTKDKGIPNKLVETSGTTQITWEKFRRTILPNAVRIQHYVGSGSQPFYGMLTATHEDAKPILQWDNEEDRNPVSQYTYTGGSHASMWGLKSGEYVDVLGVTLSPWKRDNEDAFPHLPELVLFVLDGAKDIQLNALCLFPEMLRSELHEIRATIEAYSEETRPDDYIEDDHVCGVGMSKTRSVPIRLRVTTEHGIGLFLIDRWD